MNVADFIVNFLSEKGVDTVFMVTGGQAMFLNDAVYRSKHITPIFTHHEQAASMAAEAYGRVKGEIGVAMVTAGPGAINALNGVVGAWADSSPMVVISGQSALSNVSYMEESKIRQLGLQGIYTEPIVKSVTKYFKTIDDPAKILYYLQKAYFLATSGRKGPVWLEVPLDIQRMEVPTKILFSFKPEVAPNKLRGLEKDVLGVLSLFYKSKRPLLLVGQGVRLAGGVEEFKKLLSKLNIPVITSRLGIDLVESDDKLFVGRPGLYSDRAGNFAVQNADLILSVGARLDTGIVGYDAPDWGRLAKKIVVDIDQKELSKPGVKIFKKIKADAKEFLTALNNSFDAKRLPDFSDWVSRCNDWKKRYPMVLESYKKERPVNSYLFTEKLSEASSPGDTIVIDTSSCFHVSCQTWKIKKNQRLITTGGISTMGYWVAAIGACMASGKQTTIVITGDGSLQMNVQEFATIKQNKLPIKVFVLNNNGYLLIRHTQKTHLGGRFLGESPKSGLWCPNPLDIAKAYKIKSFNINSPIGMEKKIMAALKYPGPVICNVESPEWQLVIPRISSEKQADGSMLSKPYEDLYPFLSPKELAANLSSEFPKQDK